MDCRKVCGVRFTSFAWTTTTTKIAPRTLNWHHNRTNKCDGWWLSTRRQNIIAKERARTFCSQQTWKKSTRGAIFAGVEKQNSNWNGIKFGVDIFIVYRTPCTIVVETSDFNRTVDGNLHKTNAFETHFLCDAFTGGCTFDEVSIN